MRWPAGDAHRAAQQPRQPETTLRWQVGMVSPLSQAHGSRPNGK